MIDLHCHLLPAIDDGPVAMDVSLAMARIAVADGITTIACTPHIYPGVYPNTCAAISTAIDGMRAALADADIPVELVMGADAHLVPGMKDKLDSGEIPTLAGSRYFLLEPPHTVAPPQFEDTVFAMRVAGLVPLITHPERLTWIEDHYDVFTRLAAAGVWMQITAGSLTGRFGRRTRYWAERMLEEGLIDVLATDSHAAERRPPLLAEARDAAAARVGDAEAWKMVRDRPRRVLDNSPPDTVERPVVRAPEKAGWRRWFAS